MKPNYSIIESTLSGCAPIDVFVKAKVIAAAVAVTVAYLAPLPTSAVSESANHYRLNVAEAVSGTLSDINECIVFDLQCAQEMTESFWRLRYAAAYAPSMFIPAQDVEFFESFFGVNRFISKELCDLLCAHKRQIVVLVNALTAEINFANQSGVENEAQSVA